MKELQELFGTNTDEIEKALRSLPNPAPVQVALAANVAEADMIESMLRDAGIPCLVQRSAAADVPDFLAAGQRTILVPPAAANQAQRVLRPTPSPEQDLPQAAPRVLGLVGYLRAGKDEVAAFLESRYRGVQRIAYSDPIIEECNDFLEGHTIVEANKDSYRLLLQSWSMARREEDEDYWSTRLRQKVDALLEDGAQMVILSGARLPADVALVEEYDGELWRVRRPEGRRSSHPNEAWIDNISCQETIDNSVEGDISPMHRQVQQILESR